MSKTEKKKSSRFPKLFGAKKEPEAPSIGLAITNLQGTEDLLVKKQEHLEAKIGSQEEIVKKNVKTNKRAALNVSVLYNQNRAQN